MSVKQLSSSGLLDGDSCVFDLAVSILMPTGRLVAMLEVIV